jgi:septum formation protein
VNRQRLVLASASPRRRDLLAARGVAFEVLPADVDEESERAPTPEDLAEALAQKKARAVAARLTEGVVLAADTVVAVGAATLGKPVDAADAARMLRTLSGTTHRVVTGFCARDVATGAERSGRVTTFVTMRRLTDADVADYVASGEPFGKAGGYAIQETGDRFVVALDGPFDNVVGLPVEPALAAVAAVCFAAPPDAGRP